MLSYCITATNAREAAVACVESIERTHPDGLEREILLLDNASQDGTAEAFRGREGVRVLALTRRAGAAENRNVLLREARGGLCLLLDEDTELRAGTVAALAAALDADEAAAAAGPQLVYPDGLPSPCAWRLPGVGTALAQLFFVGGALVTQSGGSEVRDVGWVQSAAMLVRREAVLAVGGYDEEFFLYSDETDLQKRLHDAGFKVLHVPDAVVVHHEQLSSAGESQARRIVQFHRSRDLYMRKHHSAAAVLSCRALWSLSYLVRAAGAALRPGVDTRTFLLHARQALRPASGEGIAEAAASFNAAHGRETLP